MKSSPRLFLVLFSILFALFLGASIASAQETETAPLPDLTNVKLPGDVPAITVLALLGTFIVSGIKMLVPRIPGKWLPFIAPVVTVLLDFVSGLIFSTASNPWVALGAGVASIGLYELKKQATTKPPIVNN